jgi:predicted nucleotidyltransferase
MNITVHNIVEKQAKKAAMEERRDRIAIAVLQGSIASGREITDMDALLRWSYEVADAMLKLRGE